MKNRAEINWFAGVMERQLRENDHKGKTGWKGWRFSELFPRLRQESDELLLATHGRQLDTTGEKLTAKQQQEIINECADVANFAMMIADNIRAKTPKA